MAVLIAGKGAPGTTSPLQLGSDQARLPLNPEFEIFYKAIDFTFSSASPLARFLCLLTKPSCLYLN